MHLHYVDLAVPLKLCPFNSRDKEQYLSATMINFESLLSEIDDFGIYQKMRYLLICVAALLPPIGITRFTWKQVANVKWFLSILLLLFSLMHSVTYMQSFIAPKLKHRYVCVYMPLVMRVFFLAIWHSHAWQLSVDLGVFDDDDDGNDDVWCPDVSTHTSPTIRSPWTWATMWEPSRRWPRMWPS